MQQQETTSAPVALRMTIAPLVPTDCTMVGLPYMPLKVERLRRSRSWLRAKHRPELGFYMMNLWTAAWASTPAGSLEDDDDVLADAAMCTPDEWPEVRADVLRGWLRCTADGRIYHPVVCELAVEVWAKRVEFRKNAAAARAGKRERTFVRRQGDLGLSARNRAPETATPASGELAGVQSEDRNRPLEGPENDTAALLLEQEDRASAVPTEVAGSERAASGQRAPAAPEPESRERDSFPASVDNQCNELESLQNDDDSRSGTDVKWESGKMGESPIPPRPLPTDWQGGREEFAAAIKFGLDPGATIDLFRDRFIGSRARSEDWSAKFRRFCVVEAGKRRSPAGSSKLDYAATYAERRAAEVFGRMAA